MTIRGVLKLAAVGAAAYILGAKAGRTRYEEIMSWLRRARTEGGRTVQGLREATVRTEDRVTLPDVVEPSPAYPNAAKA